MRIEVSGVGLRVSRTLRATVLAQVLLALSRFGPRVTRVSVRLARAPNPLGGIDQCCRLHARLLGEGVRAEAIDGTIEGAVARAAQRLARRVSGALLDGRPLR